MAYARFKDNVWAADLAEMGSKRQRLTMRDRYF